MADLHNLLDEVDDALEEDEPAIVAFDDNANEEEEAEEWDDGDREQLDLPAALEEVEQRFHQDDFDVGDDESVEVELDAGKAVQRE